ncbi:hypothetical protein SUGI_0972410 [Cryptomeria japonica]|nr:hypothetical protein SUGI_0972410 [Cryptomeria japonica]
MENGREVGSGEWAHRPPNFPHKKPDLGIFSSCSQLLMSALPAASSLLQRTFFCPKKGDKEGLSVNRFKQHSIQMTPRGCLFMKCRAENGVGDLPAKNGGEFSLFWCSTETLQICIAIRILKG